MRPKWIGVAAAGALLLAASLPLAAQAPGGRRGGMRGGWQGAGGGFGQGGPGGRGGMFGMMGRMPNHDPLITHVMELIYRPDVQSDLHLDIRQKNALTGYQQQARQTEMQQMRQVFQNMRQQRQQEQSAGVDRATQRQQMRDQMQTQRAAIQSKVAAGLDDILRPDQAARLHQLDLQWRGVLSIADPKVADELQIPQDERAQFVTLAQQYQAKARDARTQAFQAMRSARQGAAGGNQGANVAPPNPQALFASIQRADDAARKESEEKALAALTPEAKDAWTKAQGKPFVFRQGIQTQ